MGALLNIAIFKLSPRTNMAHCLAISILGSATMNSMHAILKLAGHTNDFGQPPHADGQYRYQAQEHLATLTPNEDNEFGGGSYEAQQARTAHGQHHTPIQADFASEHPVQQYGGGAATHRTRTPAQYDTDREVYDSNLRVIHFLVVNPLSRLAEIFIGRLTSIPCIRDVASGIFHHVDQSYFYSDGRRDVQLILAGAVAAFALKKLVPWFLPSLQVDWQTACTASLIPALWSKSTQASLAMNGDPGKPWDWLQSIVGSLSDSYNRRVSTRGY